MLYSCTGLLTQLAGNRRLGHCIQAVCDVFPSVKQPSWESERPSQAALCLRPKHLYSTQQWSQSTGSGTPEISQCITTASIFAILFCVGCTDLNMDVLFHKYIYAEERAPTYTPCLPSGNGGGQALVSLQSIYCKSGRMKRNIDACDTGKQGFPLN